MPEIINVAKQKLEAGELAIGVGLRMTRVVEVGKMMKTAGYDWLFIDMEHNSMSIDDAAQISVAAQSARSRPSSGSLASSTFTRVESSIRARRALSCRM